ncbi:hypothetical protein TIFTF001_019900 [Ficus carica]|uniref:Di19 zinc-binding domain-containing protein n=1 Tax=Ficus carica TaxID=3494 RepID=A0AA88A7I4_FICCA|nr:hypothetical protein TIFTF001_019900 [Ficus carica]
MDADFWTSRLAAAKRQYTLQNHHQSSHLDRSSIDDFEVEDDVRPEFPCPFCYEDFDIASLCSHLEDEHSYESSVTMLPLRSYGFCMNIMVVLSETDLRRNVSFTFFRISTFILACYALVFSGLFPLLP